MRYIILLLLTTLQFISFSQKTNNTDKQYQSVIFYNLENLFDTIDNPNKNDNEYLPSAKKQWNSEQYLTKINKLNSVLDSICDSPLLIGVAEIENEAVLRDLNRFSSTREHYGIVHHQSPDHRGIDAGLIYDSSSLKLLHSHPVRYKLKDREDFSTRDILYAKFLQNKDTLHVLVNHWPSRRGGTDKSEPNRIIAATNACRLIDSIQSQNPKAKIVFMGDLNDSPENTSAKMIAERLNPVITNKTNQFGGTHNYRGEWSVLDHILVSKPLLKSKGMHKVKNSEEIITENFLLTIYKGNIVPNRHYAGGKYLGGYSDHLPVAFVMELSSP